MLPVLNKNYTIDIDSQSVSGDGISHIDGYTVFVKDAVAGDKIVAKITKLNKNYGFAKMVRLISPSKKRTTPPCPHFENCGGCQLMHMNYDSQCDFKRKLIEDALLRIANIDLKVDFHKAPSDTRYRNKMVFPFSSDGNWGFYSEKSHDVVQLNDCLLGDSLNKQINECVKNFYKTQKLSFYDESTHKGLLRRVFTRVSAKTNEIMVVVSQNGSTLPNHKLLVDNLKSVSPRIKSIILNVNEKKTNLVLGDKNITLFGEDYLKDQLLGLSYEISAPSFFQINHAQTENLYKKVIELANLNAESVVLDIYCGIGTISLSCAKKAKKVIGIEIVPDAIENAKKNAIKNNIKNAEFYCSDAQKIVPTLLKDSVHPDIVILDPPRKGSDEITLQAIAQANPKKIIYVSCNPATLARDLKFLCEKGYEVKSVDGFDLFPHTVHTESVALLTLSN